jgi:hypothetical protein
MALLAIRQVRNTLSSGDPMSTTLLLSLLVAVPAVHGASCESLSALSFPTTTITKAEAVAAGA